MKRLTGDARPVFILIILSAMLWMGTGFGCNARIARQYEMVKDLKPFVPRSPAAAQKKVDEAVGIDTLIETLSEEDPALVMRAVSVLGESENPLAVPPLIGLLDHTDPSLRFVVSNALIKLGTHSVIPLHGTLLKKNPALAAKAAEVLGTIGDRRSVAPLVSALNTHDGQQVQMSVADALGKIGDEKAVSPLIELVKQGTPETQRTAAESLVVIGTSAVRPLMNELSYFDPDVLVLIIEIIGKIGDRQAVPSIVMLLGENRSEAIRMEAINSLGLLRDPAAIPVLIDLLTDPTSVIRSLSADALTRFGTEAVDPLIEMLGNKDPEVEDLVSHALVTIGLPAVDALIDRLTDENPNRTWSIIHILGNIGDSGATAALIDKLGTASPDHAIQAAEALGSIGDSSAVAPLIQEITKIHSPARHAAAEALAHIGSPAILPLIEGLRESGPETRPLISETLLKIGSDAIDPLASAMLTENAEIRDGVAEILILFGPAAVEALGTVLSDKDPAVRNSAAKNLTQIGGPAAIRTLVSSLSSWNARKTAAATLEGMGWRPANPTERTLYRVAKSQKYRLSTDWETTRYVLSQKLRSGSKYQNRYALYAFIALGDERSIKGLIDFLGSKGSSEIARIYLDSGRMELAEAGLKWGSVHKTDLAEEQPGRVRWNTMDATE